MGTYWIDLTGQQFGRLFVICKGAPRGPGIWWRCKCECGKRLIVSSHALRRGHTTSCGCRAKETLELRLKHGDARRGQTAPEHNSWFGMKQRCNNPNHRQYEDYGGRGITYCERWEIYENFLADMGEKPQPKKRYSLDRYPDNDGNYEPTNCRWATYREQQGNTRPNPGRFKKGHNNRNNY